MEISKISKNRRYTKSNAISLLKLFDITFLVLSVVIVVTPYLFHNIPKMIWIAIIAIWHIIIPLRNKTISYYNLRFFMLIIFWITYEIVLNIIGFSSASIGNYFLLIAYMDMIIKSIYVLSNYTEKEKGIVLKLVQLIILMNILHNIYLGLSIANIHYFVVRPSTQWHYLNTNAATTPFYNMLVFYIGMCLILFLKDKKVKWKIIDLISIIASYFFLLSFEPRTTSLLFSIIMTLLLILIRKKGFIRKSIIVFSYISAAIVLFTIASDWIISVLPSRVGVRVIALITTDSIDGINYTVRFELMKNSIITMFSSVSNLFFGVGYHLGVDYSDMIGQHSLITDYMAKYGLIGLTFVVLFFKKLSLIFQKAVSNSFDKKIINAIMLIYVLMSFLTYSFRPVVAVSSFLMLSLLINDSKTKEEE